MSGSESLPPTCLQSVLAQIAAQGPQTFSATPPKEAFEVWWGNEFGNRMRGSKYVARRAWYAALREMGCFDDTANATEHRT